MTPLRTTPSAQPAILTLALCAALGLTVPPAMSAADATARPDAATRAFNISAQTLNDALTQFANQSGITLAYRSELAKGLTSPALQGRYTPQAALSRLLAGSGIAFRFEDADTVVLEHGAAGSASGASPASGVTLKPMVVAGSAEYDATDPYNPDYNRPNATTATKTDTPIMQTPVAIQVIPRAVLDDQQAITVKDALKNVSGIQFANDFYDSFNIRGFDTFDNTYRDGIRQTSLTALEIANLSQIEVLKGPAAILFGRIQPGGLVNLVTKRPLETPYYSVQQQFGSYDFYRTTVDATGPILDDKSLLYRMNIAYRSNNSFRDFVSQENIFIAPSITWRPTDRFEANFDVEYQNYSFISDGGIVALNGATRPASIPISRYLEDAKTILDNPSTQEKTLVGLNLVLSLQR